jgi:hypothetical protein
MKNISAEKLNQIAAKTNALIKTVNESINWAEKFQAQDIQLSYDLKKYRRRMKKIENAITGKPVIAFFGASQVGKSYMVNSLLCHDESKKLSLKDHRNGSIVDFIKEINPEGHGNESTSVITRFTTDKPKADKLPIKLKLLSAKDLICILCDSYYLDVREKITYDHKKRTELVISHVKSLEALKSNEHNFMSEDDIYEIQEYLETNLKHAGNNPFEIFKSEGLWNELSKAIKYISPNNWPAAFAILWNKQNVIDEFFKTLIVELQKLNFSKYAYADFTAVKRYSKDERNGAILDVQTLDGIYQPDKNQILKVQSEKGEFIEIKNSALCAICAEVIFSIDGDYSNDLKNKITEHIDVLDFPGARTRLELHETSIAHVNVKEMILRGKVSYLFNSATLNYEINNLFVCMRTSQTDVRGVPGLIKNWIDYNIGETPEKRYKTLEQTDTPPLFLIFTWWNTLLGFSSSTDSSNPEERFERWLNTRFKEEIIADFDWRDNWTKSAFANESFHNYYLLRDFIKSYETNKIFDRNYFDAEQTRYEEKVSDDKHQNEFLSNFKDKFINSDLVKRFFKDPTMNWEEASIPNKDGTELILRNIYKIANNHTRTKKFVNQLSEWTEELESKLKRYHHSDNADEEISKALSDVASIHGYMNDIFGKNPYHFGDFIERLTISEKEILDLYHKLLHDPNLISSLNPTEWLLFFEYSPRLSKTNSYEENIKILQEDYRLDKAMEVKDVEDYFMDKHKLDLKKMLSLWNNPKEKSDVLAERATELWIKTRLDLNQFDTYIKLGFDKIVLDKLLYNIKKNFERLNLTQKIENSISTYVNRIPFLDRAENLIAHVTAGIINNFIHDLGWANIIEDEKQSLINLNQKNDLKLKLPGEENYAESIESKDIEELFDFMSNLSENLKKVPLDEKMIQRIPMLKNYRKWREMIKVTFVLNCNIPNYDLEANRQVGEMIGKIKDVEFSLS